MYSPSRVLSYGQLKALYGCCPQWVKSLYSSIPYPLRAGPAFRETVRLIERTEYADRSTLSELQGTMLRDLVNHAFANVPYYREAFQRGGLQASDIRGIGDLNKLPLLTRETIRERIRDFRALRGVSDRCYWDNTGGSTGNPLRFLKPNSMYPIEQAYMLAQWRRVGYSTRDRKITLRGHVIGSTRNEKRWQYNPIYNELQLSSFHLDRDTIRLFLDEVRRFRPTFIHGYPSSIVLFLRTIVNEGMQCPQGIRAVLCSSEPVFAHQRQFIEQTLQSRVFSWYGQSECVILAGECEYNDAYHAFPLYGVLELIDQSGNLIRSPGIEGEIVGTSLNNYAMPFLRYRTGDRGIYDKFERCACGREFQRLKNITGRSQDCVYARDGRAIPVTALIFAQHFSAFANIHGMQLYQEVPGELVLRIVRTSHYSDSDEREVRAKMEHCVAGEMDVKFSYVGELPVTRSGKVPFVVQHVEARQ